MKIPLINILYNLSQQYAILAFEVMFITQWIIQIFMLIELVIKKSNNDLIFFYLKILEQCLRCLQLLR